MQCLFTPSDSLTSLFFPVHHEDASWLARLPTARLRPTPNGCDRPTRRLGKPTPVDRRWTRLTSETIRFVRDSEPPDVVGDSMAGLGSMNRCDEDLGHGGAQSSFGRCSGGPVKSSMKAGLVQGPIPPHGGPGASGWNSSFFSRFLQNLHWPASSK